MCNRKIPMGSRHKNHKHIHTCDPPDIHTGMVFFKKAASAKNLCSVWFHLYDILRKTKPQWLRTHQWLPVAGRRGGCDWRGATQWTFWGGATIGTLTGGLLTQLFTRVKIYKTVHTKRSILLYINLWKYFWKQHYIASIILAKFRWVWQLYYSDNPVSPESNRRFGYSLIIWAWTWQSCIYWPRVRNQTIIFT